VLASAAALGAVKVWNHSLADLVRGRQDRRPSGGVALGAPQSAGGVASISNAAHPEPLARALAGDRTPTLLTGVVADAVAVETAVTMDLLRRG